MAREHCIGHVGAMYDDTTDGPVGIRERLIREIEVPLFGRRTQRALEAYRKLATNERLPTAIDAVEQLDESLRHEFGKRLDDPSSDELAMANKLEVRRVHELVDMIGAVQYGEKARRLRKDVSKAALGAFRRFPRRAEVTFGVHASRRL